MAQQAQAKSNVAEMPQHSLIKTMAGKYGLEANAFKSTVIKTLFPSDKQNPSNEQVAAFLVVANQYNLNPFIKEIYAFPGKGGGIIPIVSIDGWNTIINRQPQYDGVEFSDDLDKDGKLLAITAKIYRKDRSHPIMVTEYMKECSRNTDPWKQYPARMLRHKALIQAARYAFGLSGIYDPDEAERIASSNGDDTPPVPIAVISEEQRTALVNLAQEMGVVEKLGQIVNAAGFEMLAHITVDRYGEVKGAIREVAIPDADDAIQGEPVLDEPADFVDPTIHDVPNENLDSEPTTDADESTLESLITFAKDKLKEVTGGKARETTDILNGRRIDAMDLKQVNLFIEELEKIEAERK